MTVEIIEVHKNDKRKNNIGDRIKHISVEFDSIEKALDIAENSIIVAKKQLQLRKADFKHLVDDIYGIKKNKETNK